MTEDRTFKRRVRQRMSKTGESYTAARRQVAQKRDRIAAATTRLAAAEPLFSDEAIRQGTGKAWDEWYTILDTWGAKQRTHTEIARYVREGLGVDGWWAQGVTVGYERARGLRVKYQQADGFSISATKTMAVPIEVLFRSFVDARARRRWLTDGTMRLRTSQPGISARFDWEDGSTRVNVGFIDKGPSKSTVAVEHARLPDPDDAEAAKAAWKRRLLALKAQLES
jgi:hypothetical protein